MSDDGESSNVLLQKLDDHVGKNFPRMFLDFNEYGVMGTLVQESLKASRPFYSEYSEWRPYHDDILSAFDATILSSASKDGKMRNSFLIKKFQVMQTSNVVDPNAKPKGPGLLDGLSSLAGGSNKTNVGQGDLSRLG